MGIMIHSFVIGLTLAITSGPEFATLVTAITFHQLFEGLSLGIRIAGLPVSTVSHPSLLLPLLKPVLTFLFAITVPVGIALGIIFLGSGHSTDTAHLKLTQGIMSAVSAGMLI